MKTTYTRDPDENPRRQERCDADRRDQGWSEIELWNLGEATATWLGTALHAFRTLDEPITFRDASFWADLTRHANALVAFGDFDDESRLLEQMHSENTVEIHAAVTARTVAAQDALRWVADNLETLWS